MANKLYYLGSGEEVREGDRIEYATLFLRRRKRGTVVYIPEKTALELDRENKPPDNWLIRFDDGTDVGWMYIPEELQPRKRLRLVGRGADYERITAEEFERQDAAIDAKSGARDDLLGCGFLIAIALAVILLIAVIRYGLPW